MNAAERAEPARDYGGWRRRRGVGLLGLGAAGTLAMLAALLVLAAVAAANPRALLVAAPAALAAGSSRWHAREGSRWRSSRSGEHGGAALTGGSTPPTGPGSSPRTRRSGRCPASSRPSRCWTARTGAAAGTGSSPTAAPA